MRLVVMMLVVVLALCASGKTDEDIRSTIERLNLEYTRVYNVGQLDKVIDFFAEDAMTLAPDEEPVRGREALRRYYEEVFKREPHRDWVLTSIRSEQSGDLLCDSGRWTQSLPMPEGKSQQFTGYYLNVYRKIGGGGRPRRVRSICSTRFQPRPRPRRRTIGNCVDRQFATSWACVPIQRYSNLPLWAVSSNRHAGKEASQAANCGKSDCRRV